MDYKSASAEELACKVNYARDWLNKAENAIRRGDIIEAVAKLSLAKADTVNLISMLVPVPKEERRPRPVLLSPAARRKLATLLAPMILIGCFLLGLAAGGHPPAEPQSPTLNTIPSSVMLRAIDRIPPSGNLMALVPTNALDSATEDQPATVATPEPPAPGPRYRAPKPPAEEPAVVPKPVETPPGETVSAAEEIAQPVDDVLDLFDFGLDVIRSARENMGR
jgi:hypothetical protein